MYIFNSYLADKLYLYIDIKRKLGFKFEGQLPILKKLDKMLIEKQEKGPGVSRQFAEFWYHTIPGEHERTKYARCIFLREFCGFLANLGIVTYCPKVPKAPKSNFVPYIFSHKQIDDIFNASDKLTTKYHASENGIYAFPAILRLQYATGLRLGETLSLNDYDIDFEQRTITIRSEITKNGLERIIPFSDSLKGVLLEYKSFRDKMQTGFNDPKTFFSNLKGEKLGGGTIEAFFRLCLKLAGIPYMGKDKGPRLHDLRHTFACHSLAQMCDNGLDIYVCMPILATYLGHKNLDATNKYVRLTSEVFPSIIDKVNKTFIDIYPHYRTYDYETE